MVGQPCQRNNAGFGDHEQTLQPANFENDKIPYKRSATICAKRQDLSLKFPCDHHALQIHKEKVRRLPGTAYDRFDGRFE